MLSKTDIINELGKGICVFPLERNNIKENSLNLCAGEYAWTMENREIYFCKDEYEKSKRFSLIKDAEHTEVHTFNKGGTAIVGDDNGKKYIILLPLSTTLIETKEVLSVSSYIGGTYHSKVGLVSKGLGHIGTMVGPNFSGDSLIAIHNISNNLVVLEVGESFVSVVFHYLDTPYEKPNPTNSGHTDKFSALGIKVTEDDLKVLNADWRKQFNEVKMKMLDQDEYEAIQKDILLQKRENIKKYFNKKNIITGSVTIAVLVIMYILAYRADVKTGSTIWVDRYFNVGCSGIIVAILSGVFKSFKNNN